MTHFKAFVVLGLAAGIVSPLRAQYSPYPPPSMSVAWNQICRVAGNGQLVVTTARGETVEGYCVSIDAKEITVNTDKGIVRVARQTLAHLQVRRPADHQLRALGTNVRKGLKVGAGWLFSPMAPLGIVAIPATLAWGAVSTPFCILGDLQPKRTTLQEIRPI